MARPSESGRHRPGPPGFLLPAATMAGLALATSFGVTRALERILSVQGGEAGGPPRDVTALEVPPHPEPLPRGDYVQAIVGRDIFDTRRPSDKARERPLLPGAPEGARLIATVVTEDREGSTALIASERGAEQHVAVYRRGDHLEDGSHVHRIDQGRVLLSTPAGAVRDLVLGRRTEL